MNLDFDDIKENIGIIFVLLGVLILIATFVYLFWFIFSIYPIAIIPVAGVVLIIIGGFLAGS